MNPKGRTHEIRTQKSRGGGSLNRLGVATLSGLLVVGLTPTFANVAFANGEDKAVTITSGDGSAAKATVTIKGTVTAKGADGLENNNDVTNALKLDETLAKNYKVKIAGDATTNVEGNKCPKLDTAKDEKLLEIGDKGAFKHDISFPVSGLGDVSEEKSCKYTISVVPEGGEAAGWENTKDVYAFTVKQQKSGNNITVKGEDTGDAVKLKKGTADEQNDEGGNAIKLENKFHAAVFDLNNSGSESPAWDKETAKLPGTDTAKVVALNKDNRQIFKKLSVGVSDPTAPEGKVFAGWYSAASSGDKKLDSAKEPQKATITDTFKFFAHYAKLVKVNFLKEDSRAAEGDAIVKAIEVISGGDLKSEKANIPSKATDLCVDNTGGKATEKRFTGWKKLGDSSGTTTDNDTLTGSSAPMFDTETSYVAQCESRPKVTFQKGESDTEKLVDPVVVDAEGKLPAGSVPDAVKACGSADKHVTWKNKTGGVEVDLTQEIGSDITVYPECVDQEVTFKLDGGKYGSSDADQKVKIKSGALEKTLEKDKLSKESAPKNFYQWKQTKKAGQAVGSNNPVFGVGLIGYTPQHGDELTAVWAHLVTYKSSKSSASGSGTSTTQNDLGVEYVLGTDGHKKPTGTLSDGKKITEITGKCAKGTGIPTGKWWKNNESSGDGADLESVADIEADATLTAVCKTDGVVTVTFKTGEGKFEESVVKDADKDKLTDNNATLTRQALSADAVKAPLDEDVINVGNQLVGWTVAKNASSEMCNVGLTKKIKKVDNAYQQDDDNNCTALAGGETVTAIWQAKTVKVTYKKAAGVTGDGVLGDAGVAVQEPYKGHPSGQKTVENNKVPFTHTELCGANKKHAGWTKDNNDVDLDKEVVTDAVTYTAKCVDNTADPSQPAPPSPSEPSTPSVPSTPDNSGSGSGSGGGSVYVPSYSGGGSAGGSSDSSSSADKGKDNGKKPAGKKPAVKKPAVPQLSVFDKQFTKPVKLPANAVVRSAGADRVATSLAALSLAKNKETVVLATGNNFPDALTGGALAGALKAGVVLTTSKTMEQSVVNALKAQGTKTVYIVGGQSVVPTAKETALQAAGLQVIRLAGADRYETAALVKAETLKKLGGKAVVSCNATGANFPDALACASAASLSGGVVDLVRPGQSVAVDKVAGKTICAGGSACAAASGSVTKVVGSDRYETAYLLASTTPAKGKVLVANGMSYADSLVAGALAGSTGANLVLSNAKRVNVPAGTTSAHLFGGNAVLPDNLPMYTK